MSSQTVPSAPGQSEFDRATTVRDRGDGATFDVDVDSGWTVGPKPNGGYLLATAARAAGAAVVAAGSEHVHPLAATAHYVRAPDAGPAEVTVEVLRLGRGASQARTTLSQGGEPCVDIVFTLGTLPPPDVAPEPWWTGPAPFDVAPYDECMPLQANPPGAEFTVSIMDRADVRLDPAVLGFALGQPSGMRMPASWVAWPTRRPAESHSSHTSSMRFWSTDCTYWRTRSGPGAGQART